MVGRRLKRGPTALLVAALCSTAQMPAVSEQTRGSLDRAAGGKAGDASSVAPPVANSIDPDPINQTLSMHGAATEGIYRAAIGRIELLNGTPIGREMGMATRLTIFGSSARAFLDAEMIVSPDELQRVLLALRTRNLNISAIRNHLVGEHPPAMFVHVWGQGTALELARALRFVLDVEVGAGRPGN